MSQPNRPDPDIPKMMEDTCREAYNHMQAICKSLSPIQALNVAINLTAYLANELQVPYGQLPAAIHTAQVQKSAGDSKQYAEYREEAILLSLLMEQPLKQQVTKLLTTAAVFIDVQDNHDEGKIVYVQQFADLLGIDLQIQSINKMPRPDAEVN